MNPIKIQFSDFWEGFDPEDNWFITFLRRHFPVELSDRPDFLIYSCFGTEFLKFRGIRIFYTGENMRPDFRFCDYAFSFDTIDNPRNYTLPLYRLYFTDSQLAPPVTRDGNALLARQIRFCNMVVSNGDAKERIAFFHHLSKYLKVDSGGRFLNNIGGPVADKRQFIRNYAFTLAFENASHPGYITEKIAEPWMEGSIPIYWGNPTVEEWINPDCFINLHRFSNYTQASEYILEVYQSETLRKRYLEAPFFRNNLVPEFLKEESIAARFGEIFESKGRINPVSSGLHLFYYYMGVVKGKKYFLKQLLRC